jgi:hypothetical protein
MKKQLLLSAVTAFLLLSACKKKSEQTTPPNETLKAVTEAEVNLCDTGVPPDNTPAPYLSLAVPANMSLATYTVNNNVVTFTKSGLIGTITGSGTSRKWNPTFIVPSSSSWTEIKINDNVTLTGNIQIKKTNFIVTGVHRDRSVIDGSKTPYSKGNKYRFLCPIRHDGNGTITIKNIKSLNPANFHLTGFSKATIDNVKIIDNRKQESTDAFHFAKGGTVNNSWIDTYDDVLYIGETTKISNSTIYHNKNGAIFMASWGQKISDIGTGITVAENCTFIDNLDETSTDKYGHGVVGWSRKCWTGPQTAKVKFVGCIFIANPNKKVKRSEFVSFGNAFGEAIPSNKLEGATIELIDAKCSWGSPIRWGVGVDWNKTKLIMTTCKN